MKVTLTLAVLIFFAGTIAAADNPVDKGSLMLAGNAFFMSQSGDLWEEGGDAFTTITFMPTVGYFVSPGLMIGGNLVFSRQSQGDASLTDFAIGPTIGYYFNTNKERAEVKGAVYPFISGFFTYGKSKFDAGDWDSTTDIMQFGGHAGILYMLSSAVGLNAGINFWVDSYDFEGAPESIDGTTLQIGAGFTSFIYLTCQLAKVAAPPVKRIGGAFYFTLSAAIPHYRWVKSPLQTADLKSKCH
ncbi:MAG: hypothetical protein AB1483_11450 [Candidatus Zixiibacteriota bacterium]